MVVAERFTYRPARGPQDLELAVRYRSKHPITPDEAVAQLWFVVEDEGVIVANLGAIDAGPQLVLTDLYVEPSRRGLEAAHFVLGEVRRAVSNGRWQHAWGTTNCKRGARWLEEAGFRAFTVYHVGGAQ